MTYRALRAYFSVQEFLARLHGIWSPHGGQLEFLLNPAKIKVLACGRRWGKTDCAAVSALAALFRDSPTRHLVVAPTLDQATILFDRVAELLQLLADRDEGPHRFKLRRSPYPRLDVGPHRLTARSGFLGRALRGAEATHIVVDEAAYLPEEVITEIAMPMLATTEGYLSMLSTPHGRNHFWRFYQMGVNGEHGVYSRAGPSSESPLVSPSFLEVQRSLVSERAFRTEYEAAFADGEGCVFSGEAIDACLVPRLPPVQGPFYVGVDWGRYHDYTAVAVLGGDQRQAVLVDLHQMRGLSWSEQLSQVATVAERWQARRLLCDATGLGDPLIEQLQARLTTVRVEGLTFTRLSKAELIDGLAMLIDRGGLKMTPHPELIRELQHFEAQPTGSGHTRLQAAASFHDDLVISLALAARTLPRPYVALIAEAGERRFALDRQRI